MKYYKLCILIGFVLAVLSSNPAVFAQTNTEVGCQIIEANKPLLFISYEKFIASEKRADREVQLRLNNNSTCTIVFKVPQGSLKSDEIADGQIVDPVYEFPTIINGKIGIMTALTGDAVTSVSLKSGRSTLFNVPLRYFKQTSKIQLPFEYDWEIKKNSVVEEVLNFKTSSQVLQNYIFFYRDFLPKELRK